MNPNASETTLLQKALCYEGYPVDQDGIRGSQTEAAINAYVASQSVSQGGFVGKPAPPSGDLPADTTSALTAYYGAPSKDFPHLTTIELPYAMVLSWETETIVEKISVHQKAAPSLLAILRDILKEFGTDGIIEHGLHLYGGCYNHRKMRGGPDWSRHAWGIAIDINPDDNGLRTPWQEDKIGQPGFATMPVKAIEIFEEHGWKAYARSIGRDAMHFQRSQ